MSISDAEHTLFLFIRAREEHFLWSWREWTRIAAILDPLVLRARGRAEVESTQADTVLRRAVRFGAVDWSERGHAQWTHNSPVTSGRSGNWRFDEAHLFAPAWATCVEEDVDPDVYLEVNGSRIDVEMLLISASVRLGEAVEARNVISELRGRSERPLVAAEKTRPFIFRSPMGYLHREVPTLLHEEIPSVEASDPTWWTVEMLNECSQRADADSRVDSGMWATIP